MTLPTVFSCALVLLPIALIGCGNNEEPEPVDSIAAQAGERAGVPVAQEGAVVTLVVPSAALTGAAVPIRLRVTNATAAPLDLYLRGREIAFDIAITDSAGDAVWRRLEGEVVPAILQLKTLAPGEALELSHDWDQKSARGSQVEPGRYTVRGSILTDGTTSLDTPPVTLEIAGR